MVNSGQLKLQEHCMSSQTRVLQAINWHYVYGLDYITHHLVGGQHCMLSHSMGALCF